VAVLVTLALHSHREQRERRRPPAAFSNPIKFAFRALAAYKITECPCSSAGVSRGAEGSFGAHDPPISYSDLPTADAFKSEADRRAFECADCDGGLACPGPGV